MSEPKKERSRQVNIRFTPDEFGALALIGTLQGLTPGEQAYELVKEGLRRRTELPEVETLLDSAGPAREAITKIEPC